MGNRKQRCPSATATPDETTARRQSPRADSAAFRRASRTSSPSCSGISMLGRLWYAQSPSRLRFRSTRDVQAAFTIGPPPRGSSTTPPPPTTSSAHRMAAAEMNNGRLRRLGPARRATPIGQHRQHARAHRWLDGHQGLQKIVTHRVGPWWGHQSKGAIGQTCNCAQTP